MSNDSILLGVLYSCAFFLATCFVVGCYYTIESGKVRYGIVSIAGWSFLYGIFQVFWLPIALYHARRLGKMRLFSGFAVFGLFFLLLTLLGVYILIKAGSMV